MDDHQLWLADNVSVGLTESLGLVIAEERRFKEGGNEFYHYHTQFAAPVILNDYLTIIPGYRRIRKKSGDDWATHHRAQLELSYKNNWGKMGSKARARLQYTDTRNTDDDPWVVRPYVSIYPAKGWTDYNIKPYVALEIFYDLSADDFNRVRNYVGVKANLMTHVNGSAYVLRQDQKSDHDWQDTYIMGLSAGLKF